MTNLVTEFKVFWSSQNNRTGVGIALCTLVAGVVYQVTKNTADAVTAAGIAAAIFKIVDPDFVPVSSTDEVKAVEDVLQAVEQPSISNAGAVIADAKTVFSETKSSS